MEERGMREATKRRATVLEVPKRRRLTSNDYSLPTENLTQLSSVSPLNPPSLAGEPFSLPNAILRH
ncbi:hypothetical protein QQP08_004759 [Theobroma cacao]|nr:hypothetical protein QQP08_004759 [Theobroma cacao]